MTHDADRAGVRRAPSAATAWRHGPAPTLDFMRTTRHLGYAAPSSGMPFGMRHDCRRRGRATAITVAAIVTIAMLGGCSSGSSKTESIAKTKVLAAQHKALTTRFNVLTRQTRAVERTSRVVAANRARLKAALRHTWQQRAAANRAAQQRARRAASRPGFVEVFSSTNVCARNGANKHGRQQALYYLNLSCPAS
jgi:hypothetical protein